MQVWRIHLRSDGVNPTDYCLEHGIIGFGWPLPKGVWPKDWKDYYSQAQHIYGDGGKENSSLKTAGHALHDRMNEGDLVWTRSPSGRYFIGNVIGPWEYRFDTESDNADIHNVRPYKWYEVGSVASVPGQIVSSFFSGRVLQRILKPKMIEYSKYLANENLDGAYVVSKEVLDSSILSLISPDDCEDLLGLYLQAEKGYAIIPSTNKSDTVGYEYELVHRTDGHRAVVQVKQGLKNLHAHDFVHLKTTVYLFSTMGECTSDPDNNIYSVPAKVILDFMKKKHHILPDRIKLWIKLSKEIGG